MKAAFTLLELVVVLAVLAVLAAIAIPAATGVNRYAARVKSISNLRQIGVAARLYASDHDQQIPGKISRKDPLLPAPDNWPKLFCAYLTPSDPRVFLDPLDPAASKLPLDQVLSNETNNTGFVYNGFDDLFPAGLQAATVSLNRIPHPGDVLMMSQKAPSAKDFYVDVLSNPLGEVLKLLNPKVFDGGSHYLFIDGSVRFLKASEYSNTLWLSDKTINLGQALPRLVHGHANDMPALELGDDAPRYAVRSLR